MMWSVSVVQINAITVAADQAEELARRFATRAGEVEQAEGFEGFELLRPTDGRDTWLVVTRWRDDDAFRAWVASPAFAHGHREAAGAAAAPKGRALATSSELWSYEVADLSGGG
jgi:heme-degrading monooxygenase HmoA